MVAVAQERSTLGAQRHQLPHDLRVVRGTTAAARGGGLEEPLAQRAIRQLRQQRLNRRVLQRDQPFPGQATRRGGRRGTTGLFRGETGEFLDAVDHHSRITGRLEHVLAELRREAGQLRVDFLQA